ncbi:MAG: extracellular solute-binding protein [Anaerolineaceae bacterium]|nr:extracellular solute-binding protein [Anaerolineaceae bacterium]
MKLRRTLAGLVLLAGLTLLPPAQAQGQGCSADAPCELDVFIGFDDQRHDWAQARAAEFGALFPQYRVNIVPFPDYRPLLDSYILAHEQGNPPEVVQLLASGTQFALDSGYFKPVSQIIAGRDEVLGQAVDFDDIVPVVASYYTVHGEWASVPWNTSTLILYANQTLLDRIGVASLPLTWQELEAICAQLQPLMDDGTLRGCIVWPNHGWFFEQWLAQQNTELVNGGNGREGRPTRVDLTSAAALNIAQWHRDMYRAGYYLYSGTRGDWLGAVHVFATLEVPFMLTSSAGVGGITRTAADMGLEVTTGRMVYDAEVGWTGNTIGGATMWITAGLEPEIEEAALAFLLFFSNTENSASWHQATGYVPVRQSAVALLDDRGWFAANPAFRVASEQLADSQVTNATRGAIFGTFVETHDLITQAIEDAMLTDRDLPEIMRAAEAEANLVLEEYNLLFEDN